LGALYGLLGRLAPFRLRIAACSRCGRCDGCPMGAADSASLRVLAHQCILCFDYEYRCPTAGFGFGRAARPVPQPARLPPQPDAGRREFLRQSAALAAGALAAGAAGLRWRASATPLLRPPGVVDEAGFLERCLRCLQCVRSCPNEIIRITGPGGGLASLFTPHLEFGEYGCDYLCQVCQRVCPNFAIPLQTLAEKQATPIGRARISEEDCVVFRDRINCLVCEEVCPVPGKAIRIREETVAAGTGGGGTAGARDG
jgi:ferredoxin